MTRAAAVIVASSDSEPPRRFPPRQHGPLVWLGVFACDAARAVVWVGARTVRSAAVLPPRGRLWSQRGGGGGGAAYDGVGGTGRWRRVVAVGAPAASRCAGAAWRLGALAGGGARRVGRRRQPVFRHAGDDGDELLVRASAVLKSQGPENWSRGRPAGAGAAITPVSASTRGLRSSVLARSAHNLGLVAHARRDPHATHTPPGHAR